MDNLEARMEIEISEDVLCDLELTGDRKLILLVNEIRDLRNGYAPPIEFLEDE